MAITHTHVALPTFADPQDDDGDIPHTPIGSPLFDALASQQQYAQLFTPPAPRTTSEADTDAMADTTLLSIAAGLRQHAGTAPRPDPAP